MITVVDKLENIHEITVTSGHLARSCVGGASAQTLTSYRANVALPYINSLDIWIFFLSLSPVSLY